MNNLQTEIDKNTLISFGAGMLFYVAIVSFLHLTVFMISKDFMIIHSVDPMVIFWGNELLYLTLFFAIVIKAYSVVKRGNGNLSLPKNILKMTILAIIIIQIIQFIYSYFLFDIIFMNYRVELEKYFATVQSGYLATYDAVREFVCYLIPAILIFKK